jgi:hypothetical protein
MEERAAAARSPKLDSAKGVGIKVTDQLSPVGEDTKRTPNKNTDTKGQRDNPSNQSFVFHKSQFRKSILDSGWVQNTVVSLAFLCLVAVGGIFMKNPKIIILLSALGITAIVWFIAYLLIKSCLPMGPRIETVGEMDKTNLYEEVNRAIKQSLNDLNKQANDALFEERFPGVSCGMLIRIASVVPGRDNYIFDCGESLKENRFSAYIDGETNLCFRIINQMGAPVEIKVKPGLETFLCDAAFYLRCEYGYTDDFSFIRIVINGSQKAEQKQTPPIPIPKQIKKYHSNIGFDLSKQNGGVFIAGDFNVYSRTLNYADEGAWLAYMNEQIKKERSFISFNGSNGIVSGPKVFTMDLPDNLKPSPHH